MEHGSVAKRKRSLPSFDADLIAQNTRHQKTIRKAGKQERQIRIVPAFLPSSLFFFTTHGVQ
jgi:hypothetical protein